MMVLVLTACPPGLRGHLTRWLMEVTAGVYVGQVSRRVREELWSRVIELSGNGRALLLYTTAGEQRLAIKSHGHHWVPEDHDGITLMRRPPLDDGTDIPPPTRSWSAAGRRRRAMGRARGKK